MENIEYLAFVDELGKTSDGKYIYRFDFSDEPEVVWGEYFNVCPSIIVPDLQPDINTLSMTANVISEKKMSTAKRNACFSMQDCIDGIIALAFYEIEDNDNQPLYFMFGENLEEVKKKLTSFGMKLENLQTIEKPDDVINSFIESINEKNNDDLDPIGF